MSAMARHCLWASLILAVFAGGCAVGPNYHAPPPTVPEQWSGPSADTPTTQPSGPDTEPFDLATWWKALHDPTLDELITKAIESNPDLQLATARVREARALRDVASADFWPQVNLGGSYSYSGVSENAGSYATGGIGSSVGSQAGGSSGGSRNALRPPTITATAGTGGTAPTLTVTPQTFGFGGNGRPSVTVQPGSLGIPGGASPPTLALGPGANGGTAITRQRNLFQWGFDATWELDVFGGTRRAVEAADADLGAAVESRRDVLVTLISEVALNYVELRGAQRRLRIARENIAAQRDTVELTEQRYRAGFIGELDVAQATAQLATTESQVPLLETAARQAIYQLSVLVGEPPGALLAELEPENPLPVAPPPVPLGMPSDLLRRRPDIRVAERQLAAATARIGQATADLFPKFDLTGSIGPQASDIRHILDAKSLAWSVGPGVSWPIFDGGRIRANIAVQDARTQQALATFQKTVLTALQDVENALIAYGNERERYAALTSAEEANSRAVELSNDLYVRGLGAFLNVLDSQRALYASQDALVQSEITAITDLISLYKALGGGWDAPTDASGHVTGDAPSAGR
jgi:multidrug efflux system outer membrane protein